jgi:L-asparaginase/beta-aspartyl-peptidase (threonine type)
MTNTEHALIVGEGVGKLVDNSVEFFTPNPSDYYRPIFSSTELATASSLSFGTVGAAAIDETGLCSAATATAGVLNKRVGRVGDTAILGAGTWAGSELAVSCTGQGEYFLRRAAAAQVEMRANWLPQTVDEACRRTLDDVGAIGGKGGLVAAHVGGVSSAFNTAGFKRAWISREGKCVVRVD